MFLTRAAYTAHLLFVYLMSTAVLDKEYGLRTWSPRLTLTAVTERRSYVTVRQPHCLRWDVLAPRSPPSAVGRARFRIRTVSFVSLCLHFCILSPPPFPFLVLFA